MSFVSYAQNFEDVMLWRALKQVKNGFYIDVGANDPNVDSVTRAFYERGWHGINIEPLISHHRDLERERPNDINLCCAAGAQNGELELWECDIRGWATASNTVVEQHKKEGHEGIFHKVPVVPLSDICAKYVTNEIHFLKIDVEGFEKSVIEGMDFSLFRPWVVVVEATQPNSTEEVYEEWDNTLLAADYVFAYADGLNRFYVSREHSEILTSLRYPPNVFDEFIRSEQLNSELRAQQAQERAAFVEAQSQQIDQKCTWLETEWDAAKQRIEELSKSTGRLEAELQQAENLALELDAANEQNSQLQAHAQWLENEWDAANEQNSQLQAHAQWLQNEWDAAKQRVEEHNSQFQVHAQRLQNELDEISAKVHELNQQQQIIYASKFWRLTWPLRKIMQAAKWTLVLPARAVRWALRLPRRIARLLAVNMKSTTSHSSESGSDPQNSVAAVYPPNVSEESINNLPPRTSRIYTGLKKASEARKN